MAMLDGRSDKIQITKQRIIIAAVVSFFARQVYQLSLGLLQITMYKWPGPILVYQNRLKSTLFSTSQSKKRISKSKMDGVSRGLPSPRQPWLLFSLQPNILCLCQVTRQAAKCTEPMTLLLLPLEVLQTSIFCYIKTYFNTVNKGTKIYSSFHPSIYSFIHPSIIIIIIIIIVIIIIIIVIIIIIIIIVIVIIDRLKYTRLGFAKL